MAQLPLPPKLSTDPDVNSSAMAWAGQLVNQLQQYLNGTAAADLGFLKLLVAADHRVAFGSVTLTWPGGTPLAGSQTITHGLPGSPFVWVTCTTTGAGTWVAGVLTAVGATTFQVNGVAQIVNPAVGQTATAYWLAIA